MSHHHSHELPPEPGRLALPGIVQGLSAAAAVVGAGALALAYAQGDAPLLWSSYLIGVFYALGLGVFGVAWLAILYLSRADWSVSMRRIPEAMTAWLLPGGALAMVVGLGAHSLYHWSHAEVVAGDPLLTHKAPFLNLTMFVVLVGASLVLWVVFARLLVGTSHRQDRDGGIGPTRTSRTLSALFLVIFALTLSIVSFYFLLSLDAHWFSTMFAVLVFTDVVQTGTAFVAVVAGLFVMTGTLKGFLNENHLHSLAKMVFAATGFWAYIYFCQHMLIWYANIPEETIYFMRRTENGWLPYLLLLPALKFVVPFLLLLPREAKRNPRTLVPVSLVILFAQFWELYVMVGPAVGHGNDAAHAHLPIVEFAATLGFVGLFTLVLGWFLGRHNAVPLKDPSIAACLEYHS
jgi:magnesium-transporting ATPase (P-type)